MGRTRDGAARFGAWVVGVFGTGATLDRGAYSQLIALREVGMAAHSKVLKGVRSCMSGHSHPSGLCR